MKRRSLLIVVISIIAAGLLALFLVRPDYFSMKKEAKGKPEAQSAAQEQPPSGHAGHGGAPVQQEPSTSETAQEVQTVEIPPDKQQLIGVQTVKVTVRPLQKIVRTVGQVQYDERRLATVNTKIEGWIEKLYVNYTGQYVKRGEVLAEIYSPELFATQQEFLNLLTWSSKPTGSAQPSDIDKMLTKDAESLVNAARQRLKLWDITDAQIRKIEETGRPIRTLAIYSPVSGYVVQKNALQGMRVMPGEKLFDVADLSSVWIVSDIYEYELPLVKQGQTALISLSYFPGKEFRSTIEYVYPTLSGETRTAKVRFTIANPGNQLRPQMFTNVEIKIPLGSRLAVPEEAVIDTGTRHVVYVDKGEGYFEPREVIPGMRAEGMVEIQKGLKPGEVVASSANFLIDSEARLKGVVTQ